MYFGLQFQTKLLELKRSLSRDQNCRSLHFEEKHHTQRGLLQPLCSLLSLTPISLLYALTHSICSLLQPLTHSIPSSACCFRRPTSAASSPLASSNPPNNTKVWLQTHIASAVRSFPMLCSHLCVFTRSGLLCCQWQCWF